MAPATCALGLVALSLAVQAQFVQRWHMINGKPHWHRFAGDPYRPVLFPEHDVVLEYNCYWMPAICRNVRNWMNDATKSSWPTRQGPDVFTVDKGSTANFRIPGTSGGAKAAKKHRGDAVCPRSWSQHGKRCPERDQPVVMPGPWFFTELETIDPVNDLEIEGFRIFRGDNDHEVVRSGRQYTCDEFPPRSWIEGGNGPGLPPGAPGDTGGSEANTYCAPQKLACKPQALGRVRSEQDWQGVSHIVLSSRLKTQMQARVPGITFSTGDAIAFRLRLINDAAVGPARVWWQTGTGPPEHRGINARSVEAVGNASSSRAAEVLASGAVLAAADYTSLGYVSDEVVLANGSVPVVRLGDRGVVPVQSLDETDSQDTGRQMGIETGVNSFHEPHSESNATRGLSAMPSTRPRPPSSNLADVDEPLARYSLQTHQQPTGDSVDVLALGTEYILGQTVAASRNATANATTPWSRSKRADGPIQCSPDAPCKDGSCCNAEGKCGFKQGHCGATCISNCGAKAMCGVDSADGTTPCGLKLCCSYYGWCGTEAVHCRDPEPRLGKTPCQQGFGSCELLTAPACGRGSGSSRRRRVGYYQGWNTRERRCDRVWPRHINTRGLSHLFFAFAYFHPTTFQMMPMHDADVALYGEFTALKRNGLQTWIAVGGWAFNDPGPTQRAFSDMVSSAESRAAFVASLVEFMHKYGFQGADIDWEYPSEPKRGGRPHDAANLVLLVKEMRAAFAPRNYGLSLALAPDYWYLRGFRPADMQHHVDFLGFMSYDLHGPWDADVKALGAVVLPQTDVTEIKRDLMPLWYDGVEPSKVNLGIAYYGRTYTLSDPACGRMGCGFVPGKGGTAGDCTAFSGVLSNREIGRMVDRDKLTPYLNETAMVKYVTYGGNSWVGYDDDDTLALKQAFADESCLGGTMIWSVDFDAETGGGGEANGHRSPELATVIPMAHTTVAPGATFTLSPGATTDVPRLPRDGRQNSPEGPGADKCGACSFFRLITSTCCGTGGSVGNPVAIPAGVPVPVDIPLPSGFVPGQPFTDSNGNPVRAGEALPREAVIPRGTSFPLPFVIPAGQPLREGDDDDRAANGTLVWISPDIWNKEHPEMRCFPPCTMVLPPWPNSTTTIDYPIVTWTDTEKQTTTTITFPPVTQSLWPLETIVVDDDMPTQSARRRTTTPVPQTTTAWTRVEWWDREGYHHSTRPTFPPPPPPPLSLRIPEITIVPGPPFPTVTPCAFPGPGCPPPPEGDPDSPGGGADPEDPDDPEEDDEPDDGSCRLPSSNSPPSATSPQPQPDPSSTSTSVTDSAPPPPATHKPEPNKPDTSKDKISCYDQGQWSRRWRTIVAIEDFCKSLRGQTLRAGDFREKTVNWPSASRDNWEGAMVKVELSVEIKDGCEWQVDETACGAELRKPVDQCDTDGEDRKQGGTMENNCIKWRIDPNTDF